MKHACGSDLYIKVSVENMYASVGEQIRDDKVYIRSTELVPQNIRIIYGSLYCPVCNVIVEDNDENSIKFYCVECKHLAYMSDLCILSTSNKKYVRPIILHKTCVKTFKDYVIKQIPDNNIEFIVKELKLELIE